MALRITCTCGYVIQGYNDDEFWENAQDHMGVLHPELVGNVTREDPVGFGGGPGEHDPPQAEQL
jgi:hypothetical protein